MPSSIASSTAIDLSRIPAPDIIGQLDYAAVLAALRADLLTRWPEFSAIVESDPVSKILEVSAYRETVLRAEFNQRSRGVLIAYATGADLDNLAALYAVTRLIITPADPLTGAAAVMEGDDALRARVLLAPDSFTVAGPASAYVFHALSVSGAVLDASATSPSPGEVVVAILAQPTAEHPDGSAPPALVASVAETLSADTVRPLTDHVTVQSAVIAPFAVIAELTLFAGPDANLIMAAARTALDNWLINNHRLGRDIPRSALIAALHVGGVQRVNLISPPADIVLNATQAGFASSVTVTLVGYDE